MKKNVIIVDDEESGANVLKLLIEKYFEDLCIQTICNNSTDAYNAIRAYHPDIVFLDIKMPKGNGFDLLDNFDKINFAVIFVTAYDEYALRAIKLRAVDYLLKPLNKDDLEHAVQKAVELLPIIKSEHYYIPKNSKGNEVFVLNKYKNNFVYLNEILFIEADSNYSVIHSINDKRQVSSKTLKEIDELLCTDKHEFIRIHKSVILNTKYITHYKTIADNLLIVLQNAREFEVSKRKKAEIKQILNRIVREKLF